MTCPGCSGPAGSFLSADDWNRRLGGGPFSYARCTRCGLIFLLEPAATSDASYGGEYFLMPASLEELRQRAEPERYKLGLLQRFARGRRLLEIGPATGEFSDLARRAGFEVTVIERDAGCCAFLRDVVGLEVHPSSDPARLLRDLGEFDAICMWQTIEHLPRCWDVIDAAARHLHPGGVLLISSPNPEALQFRLLGRFWAHIDAPRHRFLIPPRWLVDRGRAAGLVELLTTTTDSGSLSWNRFGWEVSLSTHGSSRHLRRALSLLGRGIARALRPLERREGLGAAYTVVLGRP